MAKCVKCGIETELHVGGVPVCPDCEASQKRVTGHKTLEEVIAELQESRGEYREAMLAQSEADHLLKAIGPGHPDGTLALRNANQRLARAAKRYHEALQQFTGHRS